MIDQNLLRGVFTYRGNDDRTYRLKRDKEIPKNIFFNRKGAFGLVGSDVVMESYRDQIYISDVLDVEVVAPIRGLRFALATTPDKYDIVTSKINNNEPVAIATSYPRTARRSVRSIYGNRTEGGTGAQLRPVDIWLDKSMPAGGVESLVEEYPAKVDAIFELVRSGDSLRDNGLVIVEDDIQSVDLMLARPGRRRYTHS